MENKQARCSPRLLLIATGPHKSMSLDYVKVIREKGLFLLCCWVSVVRQCDWFVVFMI